MKTIIALLFSVLAFISCKENRSAKAVVADNDLNLPVVDSSTTIKDSLEISIHLLAESYTILNLSDDINRVYNLKFANPSKKDSVITKKIPHLNTAMVVTSGTTTFDADRKRYSSHTSLIVTDTVSLLKLDYNNKELGVIDNRAVYDVSAMHNSYRDLRAKVHMEKGSRDEHLKQLDSIKQVFTLQYASSSNSAEGNDGNIKFEKHQTLNKFYHLEILQKIAPDHPDVLAAIKNEKIEIFHGPLAKITRNYIQQKIDKIDYSQLDDLNEPTVYTRNLSRGLYDFLWYKENQNEKRHQEARKWLRTTRLYRNNEERMDADISTMDKQKFKQLLSEIELVDVEDLPITLNELIEKHPSKFYMMDLWATWCQPCLSNMKLLDKKQLPESLTIININTDYVKDIEAWKTYHKQNLQEKVSYRLVADSEANKAFWQFLKIKSIPRYVMFNNQKTLMHEKFYAPYEPQFDGTIATIERWMYW
ncbi:MAG: TlpA disulfide reductase family protein [Nonlabens sp.]